MKIKNVIYEGTPHGSVELTQSEHFFMLNLMKGLYIYIYTIHDMLQDLYLVMVSEVDFYDIQCQYLNPQKILMPFVNNWLEMRFWIIALTFFFTHDIATNESPSIKSISPRSMTALSNVKPWFLWTVIAHASYRGNCIYVRTLSLCSHCALNGIMGIQALWPPPSACEKVGPRVGCSKCDLWLYRSEIYLYIH